MNKGVGFHIKLIMIRIKISNIIGEELAKEPSSSSSR